MSTYYRKSFPIYPPNFAAQATINFEARKMRKGEAPQWCVSFSNGCGDKNTRIAFWVSLEEARQKTIDWFASSRHYTNHVRGIPVVGSKRVGVTVEQTNIFYETFCESCDEAYQLARQYFPDGVIGTQMK